MLSACRKKFVVGLLSFKGIVCLMVVILSIQQLAQEYKVVQENLDEVTARFMLAQELIGEKESDIKAMKAKIEELEERASTIPVLQQQVLCNR